MHRYGLSSGDLPYTTPVHTTTTTKVQTGCTHFWVIFSRTLAVARSERAGAAARRRERRFRSWLRHERMTVAMALAEQHHHSVNRVERDEAPRRQTTRASVEEEVHELYDGPRAEKRPPPGVRPGLPPEPGRRGATAACGAPQGKLLSWVCHRWRMLRLKPSMVAPLRILLQNSLERKKEEEEEEEEQRKKVVAKQQEEKHEAKMKAARRQGSPRHAAH